MRIWQRLIQTIGVATLVLSLWGFYWLLDGLRREFVRPLRIPEAPFFRQVFFIMNAIDAVFLVAMTLAAIGLLLLKPGAMKVYTWLYVVLVVYAFAPGVLWTIRDPYGVSIAAASGVGDLGLAPLLFYPFPFVVAALSIGLVTLAQRRLKSPTEHLDSPQVSIAPR